MSSNHAGGGKRLVQARQVGRLSSSRAHASNFTGSLIIPHDTGPLFDGVHSEFAVPRGVTSSPKSAGRRSHAAADPRLLTGPVYQSSNVVSQSVMPPAAVVDELHLNDSGCAPASGREEFEVVPSTSETMVEEYVMKMPSGWERSPKHSIVGGLISNLLKFYLRRKLDSCKRMVVSIGGNSFQLLNGRATGFRVHLQSFGYEGAVFSELWAHTTCADEKIEFNLKRAGNGNLFAKRIPMALTVHQSEEDANTSLMHNKLTRGLIQEFWQHVHEREISEKKQMGMDVPDEKCPAFPEMRGRLEKGLVKLAELPSRSSESGEKASESQRIRCLAMALTIVQVGRRELLQAQEADWPGDDTTIPAGIRVELSHGHSKSKWIKVLDLPKDIQFKNFVVDAGWIKYTYEFQLHL